MKNVQSNGEPKCGKLNKGGGAVWRGVALAVALLPMGNQEGVACGSWGAITDTEDTSGSPASGSDSGIGWSWSWSLSGTKGSFTGDASAGHSWWTIGAQDHDTGLNTATGWEKQTQGGWIVGTDPACGCHHGAPGDAKIRGEADGMCSGSIHINANNDDPSSGSGAAVAFANIDFTGVAAGTCNINLNTSYSETNIVIGGTLSADPSITFTITYNGDVVDASGVTTFSKVAYQEGDLTGLIQKGYGTCSVQAKSNVSARSTTAEAESRIDTCTLTIVRNGTNGPCGDVHGRHGH